MISNKFMLGAVFVALVSGAAAQEAPLSYQASPAVYQLIGEDANFRVVLATWQPGQKDEQHSHSASVAYRLTDCSARVYGADGKMLTEGSGKAGSVLLQSTIKSHALENSGTTECRILLVERK